MTGNQEAVSKAIALSIEDLAKHGCLEPTVSAYVDREIRNGASTFYQRVLKQSGVEAAEAALDNWMRGLHLRDYSRAIKPVALAIRELALADTQGKFVHLVNLDGQDQLLFPMARSVGQGGFMIVAYNPPWKGCGCNLPEGFDQFGSGGELRLLAVVLGVSGTLEVRLGLVFARRSNPEFGYTVIEIQTDGHTNNTDIDSRPVPNAYLAYSLGMIPPERLLTGNLSSGGRASDYLGFPGSFQYLAKYIDQLGPYLSAMARHRDH